MAGFVAALLIPVYWKLGAVLVMGTDECSPDVTSGAFKCTHPGESTIGLLPVGVAIAGALLAFLGMKWRTLQGLLAFLGIGLPILALIGSFTIAMQDARTPPPRSMIDKARAEVSGRPRFSAQERQYLSMLTEIRAEITAHNPTMTWRDPGPHREACDSGKPPLDVVQGAFAASYGTAGDEIPDAGWPAVRDAVLRIGVRYGFTTVVSGDGRPGFHEITLKGPYDAVLDAKAGVTFAVDLAGGTFLSDTPSCT